MSNSKKVRNSSIELLRIIAMILITFHHFAVHGKFTWGGGYNLTIPHFWYNLILMGGKIGVNVFILISGYFLITDKNTISLKKIIKLLSQIIFYSVSIYLIFCLMGELSFSKKEFIKAFFPITYSAWWFASAYFLLYLFHFFLNKLLLSISKTTYQKLIFLIIICFSVIPTLTSSSYQSNSFVWFVSLYIIAAYLRLYGLNKKLKLKHYIIICAASFILTYLVSSVSLLLSVKYKFFSKYVTLFFKEKDLNILIISVSLFMIFINLKIKNNKLLNLMGQATFGVYLLHDSNITRPYLWQKVFQNNKYNNSPFLILYSIIVVCAIYIICTIIDILRMYLIEKPFMKIIDKHLNTWQAKIKKCQQAFSNVVFGKLK